MEIKRKTQIKPFEHEHTPLAFRFTALAKRYYGAASEQLKDFDLERNFFVLSIIGSHDFITQQCLANSLDIDKASMARIIDYLSEKDLVKREVNPDDRREHIVSATPKANKLIPQIKSAFSLVNENAFKGFNKQEQETFIKMTYKILDNLSQLPSAGNYQVKYIKKRK